MGKIGELKKRSLFNVTRHEAAMAFLALAGWRERIFRKNAFRSLDNEALLALPREHYRKSKDLPIEALPPSSKRWNTLLKLIGKKIEGFKKVKEAIDFSQEKMPFDHRVSAASVFNVFTLYELQIRTEFPQFVKLIDELSESRFARPASLYRWGRRRLVSNVFYYHLREMLVSLSYVPKPEKVLEIGGGYGSLARLFMKNSFHEPKNYFLVDFPETLFFAELYLQLNLPDVKRVYYDGSQSLKDLEKAVVFVPIQHSFALIDSGICFDLVINSGSIGEVSEEWVDYWSNFVDELDCRYFYSLNYSGSPMDDWNEGANVLSPRFSKKWEFCLNRMNPPFMKLQSNRHFAEIIAKKSNRKWSANNLKSRYQQQKKRVFDLQNFQECLDIARVSDDPEILLDILVRSAKELPALPKESYWILKKLEGLSQSKDELLSSLKEEVERRYQSAVHNNVNATAYD